jgi:hypothetical protein
MIIFLDAIPIWGFRAIDPIWRAGLTENHQFYPSDQERHENNQNQENSEFSIKERKP